MNTQVARLYKHINKKRISKEVFEDIINSLINAAFLEGLSNKELDADEIIDDIVSDFFN